MKKLKKYRHFFLANIVIFAVLLIGFIVYYIFMKNFPFLGYQGFIVNNYGLGPRLLAGTPSVIPNIIWLIIAIPSIIASLIFVSIIVYEVFYKKYFNLESLKKLKLRKGSINFFIILVLLLQLIFILIKSSVFDRYFLVLVPFFIILMFSFMRELKFKFQVKYLYFVVILLAIFSLIGTHDYISWNKARWQGINYLFNQGISPKEIDGGFEFNGWYLYEYALANLTKYETNKKIENKKIFDLFSVKSFSSSQYHPTNPNAISWWFVVDDKYIISFSETKGYDVIKKIDYNSLLYMKKEYIYVLKRVENN